MIRIADGHYCINHIIGFHRMAGTGIAIMLSNGEKMIEINPAEATRIADEIMKAKADLFTAACAPMFMVSK